MASPAGDDSLVPFRRDPSRGRVLDQGVPMSETSGGGRIELQVRWTEGVPGQGGQASRGDQVGEVKRHVPSRAVIFISPLS